MEKQKTAQEEFLGDLDGAGEDIFQTPLEGETPDGEKKVEEPKDDDDDKPRNRRERRLETKLQQEREAGIALAERVRVLSELKSQDKTSDTEHLKSIERLYGVDSPESREATELLTGTMKSVEDRAVERALEIIRKEQQDQIEATKKEEGVLDGMLEEIEDEFNIDLTSPSSEATRRGFFKLLERMSPKDANGNITQYADHHAVWETYQEKTKKPVDTTAKDLSVRSMTQSGASKESKIQDDAHVRFLNENGII